jgi:cephalosporin-C deacetylase-like acetyl esterase
MPRASQLAFPLLVSLLLNIAGIIPGGVLAAAELALPKVTKRDGDGYRITGQSYDARVDDQGNLVSLKVDGVEFLGVSKDETKIGGAFPDAQGAESITVDGATITARRGNIVIRYAFDVSSFEVTTEGATLEYYLAPYTAAVALKGNTAAPNGGVADVRKVVSGDAAIGLDESFHITWGRLWPSRIVRGHAREATLTYRVTCAVEVQPHELVTALSLNVKEFNRYKVPYLVQGSVPEFELQARNLGSRTVDGELVWTVKDHYENGQVVVAKTMPAAFAPSGEQPQRFAYRPTGFAKPGFYWMHVEWRVDGETCKRAERAIIYDADRYKPTLTRPADFRAFWDAQLSAMRKLPFDAKLTENPDRSTNSAIWYDLDMTIAGGKRLTGFYSAPRKPGKYPGQFSEIRGEVSDRQYERWAKAAGDNVFIGLPWPEVATYRRWVSREDNNMLVCYLLAVRMADFLRSREQVGELVLKGASRSGPLVLVCAALDPTRIQYVSAHVPTSMGISWQDKHYRGWGGRPGGVTEDQWFSISPYFDPINFAADLTVPYLIDGGVFDNLAPSPGILAFHNHATGAPFRRCSIELGGHGYFSNPARKNWPAELEAHLDEQP